MVSTLEIDLVGAFAPTLKFLTDIGLKVRVVQGASGFLEGVDIVAGELVVRGEDDDLVGELLHEAGHLAVLPSRFRHQASGNLAAICEVMHDWVTQNAHQLHPDDPLIRSILQSGECEASAWSYAAAKAIGIDTRLPFFRGYSSDGLAIHDMIASGRYFGVHGLACGGMTDLPRPWAKQSFPLMKRWLQV